MKIKKEIWHLEIFLIVESCQTEEKKKKKKYNMMSEIYLFQFFKKYFLW